MAASRLGTGPAAALLLVWMAVSAGAGPAGPEQAAVDRAATIGEVWGELLSRDCSWATVPSDEAGRLAFYRDCFELLLRDERMVALAEDELEWQTLVSELAREGPSDSQLARSLSAEASNPVGSSLLERSGLTDFIAFALNSANLAAADETAVTINLNALALLAAGPRDGQTAQQFYRDQGFWRRLGGSFTLGAGIPKKNLTGFSGFPDADKLLDAFGWDLKFRFLGDRDPRSERWYGLLLGRMGTLNEAAGVVMTTGTPMADAAIARQAVEQVQGGRLSDVAQEIGSSFQVGFKLSGQHQRLEPGMDRYSLGVFVDKGIGGADFTANAVYSVVTDLTDELNMREFDLRSLKLVVGLSGTLWRNALVDGHGNEVSLCGELLLPNDAAEVPFERERVWRIGFAMKVPLLTEVKIPFTVVYTNDANELQKQSYVSGWIGISYDLGGVKKLFRPRG